MSMSKITNAIYNGFWGYVIGDCYGTNKFLDRKGYTVDGGVWSTSTLYMIATMADIVRYASYHDDGTLKFGSAFFNHAANESIRDRLNVLSDFYDGEWNLRIDSDCLRAIYEQEQTKRTDNNDDVLKCMLPFALSPIRLPLFHTVGICERINSVPSASICCAIYNELGNKVRINGGEKIDDILSSLIESEGSRISPEEKKNFRWFNFEKIKNLVHRDEYDGHFVYNNVRNNGYITHTLEAVLWCLMGKENYTDCIKSINWLNSDNDSSSVAALTGGIAGAYYGEYGNKLFNVANYKVLAEILNAYIGVIERTWQEECRQTGEVEEC